MTKNHTLSLRMDERLYNCAKEAHQRFNEQMADQHGLPPLSFNGFMEVCINEYLGANAPDLHRVAFGKGGS